MCQVARGTATENAANASGHSVHSAFPSLHTIISQLPGDVAVFDLELRYLAVSQGWCRSYGLGTRELIGISHYQIFPEIPPRWREIHRRALGGESLSAEADHFERQDGSEQWVKWQVAPWRDETGRIGGISIVTEDITTTVLEQAAIFLDMNRYRALMNQSADPVFVHDGSGRFIEVSQRACDSVGYSRQELLGMNVVDLEKDFDLARAQAAWSLVEPGSVTTLRGQHQRKDGSRFPVEVRFGVLEFNGQRLYMGSVRDISERERTEAIIREGEKRLRQALEAAQAGIWEWDLRTNRNYWSDEVFGLYGLDSWSVEPSYDAWLDTVHPADRDLAVATLQAAVRQLSELSLEWRVKAAPGTERWMLSRGKVDFDGDGKATVYRGIVMDITERKHAEQALRESEQRYRTIFRTSPDAVTINRRIDGLYVEVNDGFTRMFGWAPDEVIGKTSLELGIWRDVADRRKLYEAIDGAGHYRNFETTFLTKDRRAVTALVSSQTIAVHGAEGILTVTRDITDRKAAEVQLGKLSQAVEQSPDSVIIMNSTGLIEYVNDAFTRKSGYARAEVVGAEFASLNAHANGATGMGTMWETVTKGEPWRGQFTSRRKDGSKYVEFAIVAPIRQLDGRVTHYVAVLQDITSRLQSEREIQRLAYYDQLTALPNRVLLSDRLKQAIGNSARNATHGALMMIDLDDFKLLNDTLGHDMGDQLLKQIARRLRGCVRRGDTLGRLGGDEFMLVMSGLDGSAQDAVHRAQSVAQKILGALRAEFRLSAGTHRCTASVGIALFANDAVSCDELLKQADLAMYQAKAAGRDSVCFFDPQMEATAKRRSALEKDLRRGLDEHQFVLHYQPQVDVAGRVLGVEALVRWQHPSRGLVSPAEFIPVAEDSGLILPLGREIFAAALAQMARWAAIPEMSALTVAVNISARQIRQPDFVDQLLDALRRTGADPAALKLEITESLLIEKPEEIIAKMAALKAHGVSFSLDDFGTGYSSLGYLRRLPLDQLKIDQSFVRDVLTDPNDAAIARTIVGLAATMGLGVIAEGVESEEQRDFLANAGCRTFQGYLFSPPLTAPALQALVQACAQPAGTGGATVPRHSPIPMGR
jgi:diguanylate cyclase (GGDEF)-like protein/PAS domain S-box-containing protein